MSECARCQKKVGRHCINLVLAEDQEERLMIGRPLQDTHNRTIIHYHYGHIPPNLLGHIQKARMKSMKLHSLKAYVYS